MMTYLAHFSFHTNSGILSSEFLMNSEIRRANLTPENVIINVMYSQHSRIYFGQKLRLKYTE